MVIPIAEVCPNQIFHLQFCLKAGKVFIIFAPFQQCSDCSVFPFLGADVLCENDEPILDSSSQPNSDIELDEEEWVTELEETDGELMKQGLDYIPVLESEQSKTHETNRGRGHTPLDLTCSQKVGNG